MNTTRKERFIQKATRLTVKVLLFSLLLSLFLYAGVGTNSALIPDDMLDASIEPGIAQADWTHPGGVTISDSNSNGRKVTAMPLVSTEGSYNYYSSTSGDTSIMSKYGIFMSTGGSGDRENDYNTVAINQGSSSGTRYGMLYAVIPLDSFMQKLAEYGKLTLSFSAYFSGGNPSYNKYVIFAYSSSKEVVAGSQYEHSDFKSSILNTGSNSTSSTTGGSTTGTGNTGYCSATGIPSADWDSNHANNFSYRTITANVLSGAKSIIIGIMDTKNGSSRHMDVAMGRPTVTFSGSANVTINTSGSGTLASSSISGVTSSGTTYNFKKGADTITMTANPSTGYHFANWSDNSSTSATRTFTGNNIVPDKTYTANFTNNTGTIIYNSNGGTGSIANQPITYGTDFKLASSGFTRTGYVLVGWSNSSGSNSANYSLGQTITDDKVSSLNLGTTHGGSTTLYAVWRLVSATISYNANGGSGSGSTSITYGTDFTLHSGSGFTRSGYVFVGWSNSSGDNNSANYSPSQTITDDKVGSFDLGSASNDGKTVTLYAVWKGSDFGVTSGKSKTDGTWGSADNPFVIESNTHLANLSEIVNGVRDPVDSITGTYYGTARSTTATTKDYAGCYFVVSDNVSISYSDTGIRPIGSSTSTPFKGNFNGNSKTITVNASLSGVDYVGIFGYMNAGSISNLTVTGTVTGRNYVGGVLGYLDWKTTATAISISNVQNKCTVSGTNYVGGVFGKIDYRDSGDYGLITMTSVSNTGAVSGASYIGGIAGYLYGSYSGDGAKVYSCYNTGNITATGDFSGGLVGQCRNTQFNSCYTGSSKNSATVKGRNYVGGFVGQLIGGSTPAPASGVGNYNNMTVVSTGNQVGGYAGTTTWQSLAKFTNYGDISGVSNVGGIVGYYTINTTQTTSYLRNEGNVIATGNCVGGILGKAERPANEGGSFVIGGTVYSTGSVKGAKAVGGAFGYLDGNTDVVDAEITVVLAAGAKPPFAEGGDGINATGYAGGVFGVVVSASTSVTGTITVSGGDVDSAGFVMGGLVGYNAGSITASTTVSLRVIGRGSSAVPESEAFINGLTLTTGAGYVGGIAGYNAGTISNAIKVTGDVLSVSQTAYTGGVAGYNAGTISNCSTTSAEVLYNATIYGGDYVGGIVGYNAGSVSYCYNVFGTIYGTSNVGAVSGNGGTITVSYTFYRSSSEPSWGGNYAAGVPDGATVTPLTAGAEADSWIVADGFKIVYTVAANTYLSVVERGTNTAYKPTGATYSASGTTKTLKYNFASTTSDAKSFTITQKTVTTTNSYTFNGSPQKAVISSSLPTGYTQSTAGSATYVTDGAVDNTITISYGGAVMGTISTTVTITTKSATFTAKALTLFENQRPGYDADVLDTAYCTISGIIGGHSVTTCVVTDNYTPAANINSQNTYTISINDIVIKDSNGVDRTANYAITKNTATLTVKLADYGRMAHGATLPWGGTVDENATWGSASNPYYIALDRHFNNLRSIVNGGSYINSIGGDAQATDRTYLGAYFVLGYDVNTGGTLTDDSFSGVSYTITSDNANWGYSGQELTKIFDKNTGTKFCDANMAEVTIDFNASTAKYVDYFSFTNGADSATYSFRIPQQFIIYGYNGAEYVEIGNVNDTSRTWNGNSTTYSASLHSPGTYQSFRVVVRSRYYFDNGNTAQANDQAPIQFAEFSFGNTIKVGGAHTPIGKDTSHAFNGHFNGNGHTVTLTVSVLGNYAGLFGYMRAGSIANLTVDGEIFATGNYVGALVGHTHSQDRSADPVIEDITTNATVTGQGNFVGGIIGCAQDTNLRGDLNNTGNVVGVNYVGGITGSHFGSNSSNATITNEGAVTGNNNVGGYAGEFNWGTAGGTVTNLGTITGVTSVGGYIGYVNTQGTMTGTLTNKGVVIGQSYVGGITGYISATSGTASIADGTVFLNSSHVHGKDYIGGIFGYFNNNGKTVNAKFNLNNANLVSTASGESVSPTGLYAGGFFGWIDGGGKIVFANGSAMTGEIDAAESTIENYGVATGNVIGGIVGVNASTTLDFSALTNVPATATINGNRSGNATVTLGGTSYTGAIIGGIAGYNGGTIIGRADGGNMRQGTLFAVSKGNYLGFIAGINGGTIQNCLVTSINASSTYAGQYVGGIAGYNASGSIIKNCVNHSTVPGTNYLGGIAGHNAGTINYSYFDGSVQGTSYIGGIAGYNTSAINNSYCFVVGTISGSNNVGGVVGSSTTNVTTSWAFYNGSLVGGHNTGNGLTYGRLLANEVGATILPSVGMDLHTDWTTITSNYFNGFYFASGVTAEAGKYLSLEILDKASSPKVTGYAQPNTATLRSTHDTNAGTCVFDNFGYGSSFDGNIRARLLDVAGGFHDLVYDGTDKAASGNQTEAFIEEVRVSGYTSSYHFSLVNKSEDTVNVGTFTYDAHIMAGNVIVGCKKNGSATISQFDINSDDATSANGAALIFFDGVVYGGYDTYYDSNLGKTLTNVTSFKNNQGVIDYNPSATETFYIYRLKSDGTMILVYSVQLSYGTSDMAGTHHKGAGVTIALDGTIISQHGAVQTADGYLVNRMQDGRTSFVPSHNYYSSSGTGYVTLNYYAIDSDYDIIAVSDRNGDGNVESEWGSVDNPYVISHWIHLLRLSEIVNQISAPINSVQGTGAGNSANARSKDVFYTAYLDGTIKKSYFLVTANITMPDYVNFKPIGGWSAIANQDGATTFYSYENNASNYFGGVFDGNFASGAYATIRLGNQFSALNGDYVGLFGVMKGVVLNGTVAHAEVKNVDVLTADASNAYYNVAGAQYVGVIVGKAQEYVLIDRAYANTGLNNSNKDSITVSGTNVVGSVVGYLGLGSEMYGEYVNYAKVSGSSHVGGVIGQIMAGAGRQGTGANAGTYYLGEYTVDGVKRVSSMTNYGSVVGTQAYTGGVIGAMTQNAAPYDGVITVFEPTFIRNEANVTGRTVVGGLVGRIELNNAIRLINTEDEGQAKWSYNGSIDSTVYEITTNNSYAGGLFGALSTMGHQIESVFSTAVVKTSVGSSSNEGNYIGGLVGYMNGGTFKYSFVSLPGNQNVNTTTDMVRGNNYVGGLVGNMALGTLDTCYVQGFKYDNNLTTARGGVAGVAATVATIKDTWALYLTADPTYQSVPANAYGNYILSFYSASDGAMNAYIDEMFVFAGLIPDSAVSRAHATGSAGEIAAKKGSISLGITLPSVGTITGYDQKAQVVFYDGSGYEDPFEHAFEAAANDSNEHNLFLRLSASTEGSVIIAKTSVRFGSISNYTNSTAWEEKYLYIGKTGLYKVDVVDHPTDDGNYHRGSYQTSYSFDYSATGNYVKTSRDLTFQYAKYSAVAPRVISSVADWNAFATDVKNSGVGGLRQYVKLANNITVTQSNLAGRESTDDISAHNFQGTFDGDGYTITININGASAASRNELGLFPQAGNATFKNLTIKGTWTNLGNDCGAFVGHARGWLTFENCISDVDMSGNGHSHGGILGSTSAQTKYDYTFIACVNLGDITSYESGSQAYGVGGIIGNVWNGYRDSGNDSYSSTFGSQPIIRLDSCRNAGNIMASYNVGGIIGRTGGATEIINCGNTGNIEALCEGTPSAPLATNSISKDGSAGGIIGLVGGSGYADVYASYNTGTVHAWGNKAGGIMGSDTEYTTQSHVTKVYYCYNTGTVSTGGKKFAVFNWAGVEIFGVMIGDPSLSDNGTNTIVALGTGQWWGVNCGGILGTAVNSDIRYCYNAGDIVVRGASGEAGTWHGRVGGIVGMVDGTTTYIRNSYNVGDIKVESRGSSNDRPKYAGGIVGYFKAVQGTEANVFDCYSLKWQIQWLNNSGNYKRYHIGGYNHSGISIGGDQYDTDTYASSGGAGHVMNSVAELTAAMKSNEEISTNGVDGLNSSGESDARVLINNDIKSGNYPGWIFLPGCLPQLAVFAVDTHNGLAMTSLGYGRNNLGEYVQQVAGSEFNPYVIKDGIDLLGVMALTSAKGGNSTFGFDGKFIEFANGTNNLAGDVCTYIQLPTSDVNSGNDYVFYDGNTKKKGKSYHLYDRGANGLHNGTLSTSDATISASNKTAPATSVYATNQESSGNFTLNSINAYATWKARNYGYNGSWTSNVGYGTANWNPIGYLGDKSGSYDRSFRGHITGDLGNGTNAEIRDINSYYGFNKSNVYAGLFGVVRNAQVENITVTGTIHADSLSGSGTASAGIVAKALDNSYISGLQAGTASRSLTVKTGKGGVGYTGGIVGMADSRATGNRLTIADSVVVNATITGFKDSIGGIVGYSEGDDAASFTDIVGCHVQKATVQSSSTGTKRLIGGIVGAQGDKGALTVSGCHVGTEGASGTNVTIKGDNSFGGIISFADAGAGCANAFIDCHVWGDVLIQRQNPTNDSTYGTAIGGIVGYVSDSTDGYATFRGNISFYGTINLGTKGASITTYDENIGGVVGYMGACARMEECIVQVFGVVNATNAYTRNIGGFAGISKGVCLDGGFAVAPTLVTTVADNVGGFIGLNEGDTYITRTSVIYTAPVSWTDANGNDQIEVEELTLLEGYTGSIVADTNVGGFIGANAEGSALHMGAAEYKGTVYGEDGDSATISLHASVDGKKYVGGFLGYNKGDVFGEYCTVINNGKVGANDHSKGTAIESVDCIGGVFGDNSTGGTISISENATFINNGQVGHSDFEEAYQEFVGGVLGVALGDITNNGVMRNTGDVFGYEYVGGAIGGLVNGTISGQLANGDDVMPHANADSEALEASDEALSTADTGSSSVTAVVNVGGVIGIVMQNAIIDGAVMYNYGHVESSGDEYEVSNLGGAIGLNYGVIQNGAQFYNYGTIKAKNFAGGALGVSDGVIRDSNFYNYATITFTGDTALGGSVGYITNNYTSHGTTVAYYPTNNAALGTYDSTRNRSQVTGSYFGYESTGDNKVVLQATGEHPYPLNTILSELGDNKMSAFVAKGGLGGVFGAINSDYMTEEGGWSGNTFFIYGDVYGGVFLDGNTNNFTPENFGGTVDAVGGVIGAIEVSHISISNMLIYKSNVGGKDYVGGIVGYNDNSNEITGAGAAIDNCYNVYGEVIGTTYNGSAISASYKHVGGIVGFVPSSTDPGLIKDSSNYNKPVTNASYWIKSYSNEHLQNSNPQDIVNTLDKASTWTEFLSHADYINNNDPYYQVDDEGNVVNEGKLAEGQTWDEYFAIHTQYVQNANEDWGTYQDVTINYNTGVKATGFYYIFAEAEEGNAQFEYAKEAIQVEHSNAEAPLTSPYTNDESLNFWLIIANSAGQSVKSYKSDQVAPYVNDGNVVPGYIYSTAFNSNKNGYYLYVSDESTGRAATSLYAGTTDANGNTQVYVSSDASTAGNVMIFYKEAVMLSYLNYNGYERYAPIADVTYKQDMTGGVYGTNYYSFTNDVAGDTINTGREAGTYDVQASIYTVDKVGTVITLGKLDSTLADGEDYKWNIRKRTLEVEFETGDIGDTGEDKNLWNRYDGTFSHYIKFTVTNFAKDEHISEAQVYEAINNMMALKYSFNSSSSTEPIKAIYDNWNFLTGGVIPEEVDENATHIAYYRTDYDGSSAKPGDKSNTIIDGNYSELGSLQIYKADYIVFVKKAGKHTVKVEVAGTEKNHSSPKKNSKDYNVDMRDLILDFTYSQGSSLLPTYDFDGGMKWQGIQSVVISGFLVGDALKDNITTVGSTASLLNGDGKADKDNIVANDNNTVTVNFFANNAGTYQAHIEISEAIRNNYRFVKQSDAGFPGSLSPSTNSYEWDASWTINKYVITLENLKITSDQVLIYNGREQSPTFSGEGGSNFVKEHGNETITIICDASVTNGSGVTKAVNVDTYKINVAASGSGGGSGTVEGENSLATNGINNYQINYTLDSEQEQDVTFEIVPREVRLVWDNPDLSYVYSGNAQGLSINDLTFEMKDDEGTWAEYKDAKISVENGKIKVSNVFAYDGKSETLYFSFSDFTAEDAGSYTAKVTEFDSVSGTNDAGSAEKGNYSASLPGNKTYNIAKSKIVVAYNNNTNLDKTFDNTSTVKANLGSVSLSSQNGGATSVRVTLSNAFFCDNSGNAVVNVGNGYSIKVNMSLSDTKNYEFVGASTQVFNVGAKITPAPLTITLNNSSSGANTVYKTFDNSDIYAVVESNGTNRVSSTGTQFRTGRGITVDGFFTDGVTVTATFAEIDGNRAWASKYVNNVIRTVSTPYVYTMSDEDFYKKLHIVLSSEGGESNNYYIAAVKNKSGTTILTQSSGQYIDVMDSRAEGSNTNGDNIKIAITKYSLKATYSNTAQSYANPDNSYNLDWLEVDGTLRIPSSWGLSSSDLDVDVANGWMYVNGTSGEKKQYEQYTRIAGSASSTRLGAVLSSDDGYDLCVTLRNQPTLVIGYFVSKDGEEIGTMAGLLIATEYFKNNFNAEGAKGYDFTQTLVPLSALNSNNVPADVFAKINSGDINTWEELIEAVPDFNVAGYTFNEVTYNPINLYYDMSTDIEILEEKQNKTEQEQAYLDALISQRDSFELTYVALTEGGEETLQYVYWKAEEISENLSFKSFVLVDNIDAILTEEDMDMLKGAFGTNWGVGKTYLPNVVFAEVGSVVIFNGPVFDYTTDGEGNTVAFDGVFDGAGYSIDHLTIAYNVDDSKSTHNVGMFAEVSGTGSQVTAINLRNLSIQVIDTTASAKVINVGGVAGKFAASTVMEDVTVHGTISVKSTLGTVHAGGVIGSDSTGYVDGGVSKVIDGAIVVATVRAEGAIAVAGGVIGIMNEVNTTLTDVVSLSEVYAKGANTYANGFVGQYAKLVDGNASYDQDGIDYAPLNSTGKTSAYMNSVFEISADGTYTRIAGGVSYDTLYDGSNSIYIENGEYVVYPTSDQKDSKPELNTYDVINEYLAGSETNARESMRLRDIVDTYVLGYELTKTTVGEIITYAKATTSKYVGTADGTADNRIGIAYQQHLNLIRMFNYMNFTLNRDVTMYTGYKLYMVDEAFTGTMTAGSYVINVRDASVKALDNGSNYPVFFANQTAPYTWLKID